MMKGRPSNGRHQRMSVSVVAPPRNQDFIAISVRWPASGGLFHVFRTIPNAFKKKRCLDNVLQEFRRRLPSPVKNSTAQNWHKAAQNRKALAYEL
jgi:hypothetical protein